MGIPSRITLLEHSAKIRRKALIAIYLAESGHPGGALSCADLIAYLYHPQNEVATDISKFILSKGHCVPALYAALYLLGKLSLGELVNLRKIGRICQGHPHVGAIPAVQTSTGSLGQGFSVAIGQAMGYKYQNQSTRIYVMLGDGELQEGQIWEGAMCAAHYQLENLCAIIDYNKLQSDDLNENVIALEPLKAKWGAFNWQVIEIDGHDFDQIINAIEGFKRTRGKPTVIIAHTVKGKGVSFMEGVAEWHGSVKLKPEELKQALRELGTPDDEINDCLNGSIWSAS